MKTGHFRGAAHALLLLTAGIALAGCGDGSDPARAQGSGTPGTLVPNVIGATQQAAATTLAGAGLRAGTVTMQASSSVPSGTVLGESPSAGSSVAAGTPVALTVSSGPAQVSVPEVVGRDQAAASSAITAAGLKVGTTTTQASTTVAAGIVISESPTAGSQIAVGSAVNLVISSGSGSGHTVGGIVIGLGNGLTATVSNGGDQVAVHSVGLAASFTLPTLLASGTPYSVSVASPAGQSCLVQNGTGTMGAASLVNVVVYCTNRVSVNSVNNTYKLFGYDMSAGKDWLFSELFDGQGSAGGHGAVNLNTVITTGVGDSSFYSFSTFNAAQVPELDDGASNAGGLSANTNAFTWMGNTLSGLQPNLVVGIVPAATASLASLAGTWVSVGLRGGASITGTLATSLIGADGSFSGTAVNLSSSGVPTSQPLAGPANTYAVDGTGQVSAGGTNGPSGYVSVDGNLLVMTYVTGTGVVPGLSIAVRQASGVGLNTFQGVYAMVSLGGTAPGSSVGQQATLLAHGDGTYSASWLQNQAGTTSVGTETSTYTLSAAGSVVLTSSTGTTSTGQISADGSSVVLAHVASGEEPRISVALRQ